MMSITVTTIESIKEKIKDGKADDRKTTKRATKYLAISGLSK